MTKQTLMIMIAAVILLLSGLAIIDAVTTGNSDRTAIIDGKVCIQRVDVWGNVEETECADG